RFLQVDRDESHEQLSEEVRLAGGAGALNYVVGAYFLSQSYDLTNHQYGLIFGGPDAGSTVHAAQDNTAYAGFGQLDYEIVDGLTVTAGLRYSWEKKKFTVQPLFYPVEQSFSASFDNLSPKIGISYKPNEDLMLYASYTRGFRAGGFNGRAASFEVVGPYDPETVSSYEAGLKSQLLDGRLTFNLGGFVANYKDQQVGVQEIDPVTLVNQTLVRNAASSKMQGIELESELQAGGGFSFSASVGYLDASFDKFVADLGDGLGVIDRSNLPLSYAPEWTTGVTANWDGKTAWGDVTAQMSVLNQSDQYTSFSPTNLLSDFAVRDANTLVNASLALRTDYGVTFRLWGKNLGDETVINNTFAVGALLTARVYQPPREFGIDLAYEF
ncbi:MAG: TonB-dependent receptor, partial [Hyphomonas sp.]|nr:TonB-dependent receptor [Hyphomonas sp.]